MDEPDEPAPHTAVAHVTPQRVLGVAGTLALLGVAVAIALMIARSGGDETPATPVAVATPTPTATPKPKPAIPKLTRAQKAQRRDAVEQLQLQGFEPVSLKTYRGDRELRVLIGRSTTLPNGQRAFFFVGPSYVGTDTVDTSERIKVVRNGERAVTLSYALYEPGGVGSSGSEKVRFEWDGASLIPQDEIPSVTERGPR